MTQNEIKQFASVQAANLSESMTELCGQVIAKGMQGIIEECVALKLRIQELEEQLAAVPIAAQPFPPIDWTAVDAKERL